MRAFNNRTGALPQSINDDQLIRPFWKCNIFKFVTFVVFAVKNLRFMFLCDFSSKQEVMMKTQLYSRTRGGAATMR